MKKEVKKVTVLYGGSSSEREVSLKTGVAVIKGLDDAGFEVFGYDLNEDKIPSIISGLKGTDIVFIAFHGGFGEDGHVQSLFEMTGIPFTGSGSFESSIAMKKHIALREFRKAGVPIPKGIHVSSVEDIEFKVLDLNYPLAVKPAQEGSTIGFTRVDDPGLLKGAVIHALEHDTVALIEEYITGHELTVSVIGDQVAPPLLIKPIDGFYDFEHKYTKGKSEYICPAPIEQRLAEKMQAYASIAFNTLGCRNYGRVDFRLNEKGEMFCLEVNTLPGMTDLSLVPMAAKAMGMNFPELLRFIVEDAYAYFHPQS